MYEEWKNLVVIILIREEAFDTQYEIDSLILDKKYIFLDKNERWLCWHPPCISPMSHFMI